LILLSKSKKVRVLFSFCLSSESHFFESISMSHVLTEQQIQTVASMSEEALYRYFIQQSVEHKQVWGLRDEEGFVQLGADDQVCLPVWPHAELAQQCAMGEWEGCEAVAIPVQLWASHWLTNMGKKGAWLTICPSDYDTCLVCEPFEVQRDTLCAMPVANDKLH
jgi:hypothetical protein